MSTDMTTFFVIVCSDKTCFVHMGRRDEGRIWSRSECSMNLIGSRLLLARGADCSRLSWLLWTAFYNNCVFNLISYLWILYLIAHLCVF